MSAPHESPSPTPQPVTDQSNAGVSILKWSCSACRQSKRRCDKMYPECTLCTQKNLPCNYPGRRKRQKLKDRIKAASSASKATVHWLSTSTTQKDRKDTQQLSFSSANTNSIAERFLDPDVFSRAQLTVINVDVPVTDDIAHLVGSVLDIQATSAEFFKSVHTWMPIISKPQFCATLLNRLTYKKAELYLLVLSMKLCCARQTTLDTALYETVKLLHFKIETSGVLSVLVLQAAILIALYELGHSIYPAAFLSVGSCARYATALGIDNTVLLSSSGNAQWIEEEERRRIWWAILVLDRYLNLSDPKRHLITPDADIESYLPVDDEAWETGVPDSHHTYTLATANSYHLGLFARFAQAAHLLSKVLHQVSEHSSETAQLRRTIFALINVSKIEASMRRLEYCSQTSICYSGILLLDASSIDKDTGHSGTQLSPESAHISHVTLDMALSFVQGDAEEICAIVSPFLVHLLYRVASIHLKIAHESPTTAALEKVELLKKAMRIVGSRWLCASTYLSLLEKQEILLVMQ
ncbi:N-terminal binuclear Zn cluster-containing/DNA binding domain-containing protein [Trichoderma aethiopicum]